MRTTSGDFLLRVYDKSPGRATPLRYEGWFKTSGEAMKKGDEEIGLGSGTSKLLAEVKALLK
jgi:hypothetical protein